MLNELTKGYCTIIEIYAMRSAKIEKFDYILRNLTNVKQLVKQNKKKDL